MVSWFLSTQFFLSIYYLRWLGVSLINYIYICIHKVVYHVAVEQKGIQIRDSYIMVSPKINSNPDKTNIMSCIKLEHKNLFKKRNDSFAPWLQKIKKSSERKETFERRSERNKYLKEERPTQSNSSQQSTENVLETCMS